MFLKWSLTTICLIGFVINSLATIKAFLNGAKVNSQHHHSRYENPVQMNLPTLVLCNQNLRPMDSEMGMDLFSMEKQDSFSWKWEDLFITVWISHHPEMPNSSEIFSVEKLYTRYYGICFALTFKHPVNWVTHASFYW